MFFLIAALLVFSTAFAQQRTAPSFSKMLAPTEPIQTEFQNDEPTRAPGDVIFSNGFEGTTGGTTTAAGALASGWVSSPTSGTLGTARWGTTSSAMVGINGSPGPNSGTRFAYIAYASTAHNAWMITPAFTLTSGTTYKIEFYTIMLGYDWYEELEVKIGTAATVAGMTTFLWENKTEDIGSWTKISITYTPTTSGSHYLGFHSTSEDQLYTAIDDISVSEAPAHDMAISANFPYTQIPTMLPLTLTAKATNAGIQTQTNVKLAATLNGTSLGTSATGITVAPGETATLTLPTSATPAAAANTLTYTVSQAESDQVPGNNSATFNFTGSTSVYAVDAVTATTNGIGSNSNALTFGNIFEISTAQTLSQVVVGFNNTVTPLNYTLSLYKMAGDLVASPTDLLSGFAAVRAPGWNIVNIPPVALEAGARYFLCVNQLGYTVAADNVAVSYQSIAGKILYVLNPDYTIYTGNSGYAAAIRMVLDVPTCAATAPTGLAVTTSPGKAIFSWTGTTPHSFMLTLNFGGVVTTYYTYNNNITIDGLAPGNYTWSVAAMCDATHGATATGTPFTIVGCADITLPWSYGFEDGTHDSSNIDCFTQESITGTNLWTVNQTYTDYSRTPRTGAKNAFLRYGNTRWLFREVYLQPGVYSFGLWARQDGSTAANASITLKYGTVATAAGMINEIAPKTGLVTGNYQEVKGAFSIYSAGNYVLGILGEINSSPWYISIDDLSLEKIGDVANVDMTAVSIAGNLNPMATETNNYVVTVQNTGLLPASNFTITLSADGNVLGTETVTTVLTGGASYNSIFPVMFTQNQAGALTLQAEVTLVGDQAPDNNVVSLAINVTPHPGYVLDCVNKQVPTTLGTATSYYLPADNYNRYGYTQQIYTQAELGITAGTPITSLQFQIQFATAYNWVNQTIYLGNIPATKTTFTANNDWIPFAQLQEVFTGSLDFPAQTTWFTINFQTPFVYNGGNIVVAYLNNRGDYAGYSSNVFRVHTESNKAIYIGTDTQGATINPATVTADGTRPSNRTNIQFVCCKKQYTLHPLNYSDPRITLEAPNPIPEGDDAHFTFTDVVTDACKYISDILFDGVSIVQGGTLTFPYTYTLPNVTSTLPFISFVYETHQKALSASVLGGNGAIQGPSTVDCGSYPTYFMIPDPGYKVETLTVDGVSVSPTNKYTFTVPINDDTHTIVVTFMECPFKIQFIKEGEGSIFQHFANGDSYEIIGSYAGVDYGMNHFTFEPAAHYTLQAVYVDGIYNLGATISGSYVFSNVTSNHTVKVVFEKEKYIILATAGPNGTITPSGNVAVSYGDDKTFTFTPNTSYGYVIDQVLVDGVNVPAAVTAGSYTFETVEAPHTIYVSFKTATMYVTASSSGCGSVSPNGTVAIPFNGTQIFTFAPNEGCKVIGVYVDGVSYPNAIPTGSYTFYYVDTEPHTLEVVFEKKTNPITAQISDHGVINDPGVTNVEYGDDKTYNFYAMPGYEIANVFINGNNSMAAIAAGTYTFQDVKAPQTINVVIKPQVYTIQATAGTGGYITPAGNIPVTYQGSQAFTFVALPGYEIEEVVIDNIVNVAAAVNGAYAFTNVSDNHTIAVSFKMSRFQIKSTVGEGGGIAPFGITEVTFFDNTTYTITPNQDYKISYVLVNGQNMGAIETFTFSDVLIDGNIEAFFLYSPVGISEQPLEGLSIYSHTNIVHIVNENNLPINDVTIFDMFGRVVWQGIPQGHSITLNVANGIYTVRVASEDNFTVTKVPIQR